MVESEMTLVSKKKDSIFPQGNFDANKVTLTNKQIMRSTTKIDRLRFWLTSLRNQWAYLIINDRWLIILYIFVYCQWAKDKWSYFVSVAFNIIGCDSNNIAHSSKESNTVLSFREWKRN